MLSKKRFFIVLLIALLSVSLFPTIVFSSASVPPSESPVVAVHISQNTQSHWTLTAWTYYSIPKMLETVLKSDGTPYVEVSDQDIESGALLNAGIPKYPILFSLASETISDSAASQISNYVAAGGFVFLSASSWTKNSDGSLRTDFALSNQIGLKSVNRPPNNWVGGLNVTCIADNRLVDDVPKNVQIPWHLPTTKDSLTPISDETHFVWDTATTASNPADVLLTIDGNVMLATKAYQQGRFIYQSELAPLSGYGPYAPDTYEYGFCRKAIEWAFENAALPLTRLSPWPYQYNSAFLIRHDLDLSMNNTNWLVSSAQEEKSLGVTGQYYIVTGDVLQAPNNATLISQIQQAAALGAEISSHNGGFAATPWAPYLKYGDWGFYHWGPDEAVAYYPSGKAAGITYASASINKSLTDLQTWLGQKPVIFAAPVGRACLDDSLQILENLGVKTTGDLNMGPYPYMAFSLTNKTKTYNILEVPTTEWITDSGNLLQTLDEHTTSTVHGLVDYLYGMGGLVSAYSHSSSATGATLEYIQYSLSKPNMWNTTPLSLLEWEKTKEKTTIAPNYFLNADGSNTLNIQMEDSNSADTSIDVYLPAQETGSSNIQILLDGVPTSNYRTVNNYLKVQVGMHSNVTITYNIGSTSSFTQSNQADFQSGTLNNLDAITTPGDLTLISQTTPPPTLFSDNFDNSTWTQNHWTTQAGTWTTTNNTYNVAGESGQYAIAYAGNSSWTNYTVESKVKGISGLYSAQIGARLNPSTGARYALWIYPSSAGGPNVIRLAKFTSWTNWSPINQASIVTDNNWHVLRMELNSNSIKCYYDGNLVINVADNSFTAGPVTLETYESTCSYDSVNVTSFSSGASYVSSGTLLSSALDAKTPVNWGTISWTASLPTGTSMTFRTRTAATQEELISAAWSSYYNESGSAIDNPTNQWIQYQAILNTTNAANTPTLYDITITYGSIASGSFTQSSQVDFQSGTLNNLDATTVPGQLTLMSQTTPPATLFADDFNNSTWTQSHWTTQAGTWTATNDTYNVAGESGQYAIAYAGNSSWTNYTVESKVKGISGLYSAQIGARLNPSTGARYALWIYPSSAGGPNIIRLAKFTSWTNWSPINQASIVTDNNWHVLRMELNGSSIKCYYDGNLVINVADSSFTTGPVTLETYESTCAYDAVNVTAIGSGSTSYVSSGTLVSSALDAKTQVNWETISWTASLPAGTSIQFRTRTAATQEELASSSWSSYYNVSGSAISSPTNEWIQYQAILNTTNTANTPTLYDITITYT